MTLEKLISIFNEYGCVTGNKDITYKTYVLLTWSEQSALFRYYYMQDKSCYESICVRYFDENGEIDITEEQVHKWLKQVIITIKFYNTIIMKQDIEKDFE